MNMDALYQQLKEEEGVKLRLYRCPAGKVSIGVGRNLEDVGITTTEAEVLLDTDIQRVMHALDTAIPWWTTLGDVRMRVLVDMGFNMGPGTLLTFTRMLKWLKAGRYQDAADEMAMSRWSVQVPVRAAKLIRWMRTNSDAEVAP